MLSDAPLVTIVVPGRDVAPYAAEAIASLRAQTLSRWRAVLVDDGSADATGAIFARAAASDARLEVVRHDRPRGLGAARNTALDRVTTPFTAFLDADDVLLPEALERLVAVLSVSGSDFVAGAYARLRPDGAGGYAADEVQPWVRAATAPARTGTTIDEHPEASGNVVAWSKLSRTALWRGLRFPEGRLYEDQVVAQVMYTQARAFDVVPDVVVHWRVREDGSSITQRESELRVLRDCVDAMRAGLRVLETAGRPRAADARARLMLGMDVPRLAALAADHPDPAYRRALGALARELWARGPSSRPPSPLPSLSAALLW